MSGDAILDEHGQPAEDKFRFYVEALLLGRTITGVSYSQQTVDGEDAFVFDIKLDDGNWLALVVKDPPRIWMSKMQQQEPEEPGRTM